MATLGAVLLCEDVVVERGQGSFLRLTDRFLVAAPTAVVQTFVCAMVRAGEDRAPCTLTFRIRSHEGGHSAPLEGESVRVEFRTGRLGTWVARRIKLDITGLGWLALDALIDGTPAGYVDFEVALAGADEKSH